MLNVSSSVLYSVFSFFQVLLTLMTTWVINSLHSFLFELFFPDSQSVSNKLNVSKKYNLALLAKSWVNNQKASQVQLKHGQKS